MEPPPNLLEPRTLLNSIDTRSGKHMITQFISRWLKPCNVLHLLAPLLLLFLVSFGWSLPVYAASQSSISSRLEDQVLQIIRDHPKMILESVQAYQKQQYEQQQQAQQAVLREMRAYPRKMIGSSPVTGASEQRIVLVEFSDFQCPYCAEVEQRLKQFMANHQREVTLVYKNFPLTAIHNDAMSAAKAAWAASQQGKFWQYHDALFAQQDGLGEALYVATAKTLNLDLEQFNRDRNGDAASKAIQQDMEIAKMLGITGTPFFVMNGEVFSGAVHLSDMENVLAGVSKLE
jgi:protein-disulfide isomerase